MDQVSGLISDMFIGVLCLFLLDMGIVAARRLAELRLALPEANPGRYLSMSLAITFPFNLLLGIPLYHAAIRWLL